MLFNQPSAPTLLLILDGFGYREETQYNAIAQANTHTWDKIWQNNPHTLLSGCGLDVGLPANQMGNSEVGHITIGAGRVVLQNLTRINLSIADQTFFENKVLKQAIQKVAKSNTALHILGLLSPGGIHSHEDHIHALVKFATKYKLKKLYIHAFLDGRDTPPQSAKESLSTLFNLCKTTGTGEIASIIGRYYAMDRDKNYERTRLAYDLLTQGITTYKANDPLIALDDAYARDETDEFVQPIKITPAIIKDNDTVIFANFRADRARQLSHSLTNANFSDFTRTVLPKLSNFISFTEYAKDLNANIAFPKQNLKNILGEYLQNNNIAQLRIAETEKYAHVTFFLNGGQEALFKNEQRILVPSPNVVTYDLKPEMSAFEVSNKLIDVILNKKSQVIIANLANPDMVGHTGNMQATIKAIETIDLCLQNILNALSKVNGQAIITADHGNAEIMYDATHKQPHTAHTNSLLPFVYIGNRKAAVSQEVGTLADVAPSLLTMLGLEKPKEMTGKSLISFS